MATPPLHPDVFAALKLASMRPRLVLAGLKVSGNKPDLIQRYRNWYHGQSGAGTSAAVAGPSTAAIPPGASAAAGAAVGGAAVSGAAVGGAVGGAGGAGASATGDDDDNAVSMFNRIMFPSNICVSKATLECLRRLRYSPGVRYRKKPDSKDLGHHLAPLYIFTEAVLQSMKKVNDILVPEAAVNETALWQYVQESLPSINASAEMAPFFAAWGVKVSG
ncbi:unnamed protein product [Periconia digitata]|uniref:SAP domain-containing protein n=1 Tax=Periconia digitata TaxID=1303443 RepID=A0A9W4U3U9_9PLEO|nr:unnamed protein product [Periconia digitata]